MEVLTNSPEVAATGNWWLVLGYFGFTLGWNGLLLVLMIWLFNVRWRVSSS
jgi:hypothetical protein